MFCFSFSISFVEETLGFDSVQTMLNATLVNCREGIGNHGRFGELAIAGCREPGSGGKDTNSCSQSRWGQENSYFDGSDSKDDGSDNPEY